MLKKCPSPCKFQILLNALHCIVIILVLLTLVCSQNSQFALLNLAAPAPEIPYSIYSCPTSSGLFHIALCPTPDALLGIVSYKGVYTYMK